VNKRLISAYFAILGILGSVEFHAQNQEPSLSPEHSQDDRIKVFPADTSTCHVGVSSERTRILGPIAGGTLGWRPLGFFVGDDTKTRLGETLQLRNLTGQFEASKATFGSVLERDGYRRFDLHVASSGYLCIAGRINDKPVNLMVDTGAPDSSLDKKRTEGLGLKWRKYGGKNGRVSTDPTFDYCDVSSIQVGPFRSGKVRVASDDLTKVNTWIIFGGDPPIDGLLGADVLGQAHAVIDYGSHALYLKSRREE